MMVDSSQLAQEAPPPVAPAPPPTDPATAETATTNVDVACGNHGSFCEALLDWTGDEALAETVSWVVGTPLKVIAIVVAALVVNKLVRVLIRRGTLKLGRATEAHGEAVVGQRSVARAEERARTFSALLTSLATAIIFSTAGIMIFEAFGVSLIPVIASAGVLSLAIGFGAQSVVEDLLRGLFMLFEDQFGVGDRIDVGDVNGTVTRVTLRTVVIRDPNGTVWHVPNSEIARVANETQVKSRAMVDVGVAYASDVREAMRVLEQAATELAAEPEWAEHVEEPPEVLGVQELGADDVRIRVIVWVAAGDRRRFECDLRLKLKEAVELAGIEMPNRQLDVWLRNQPQAA